MRQTVATDCRVVELRIKAAVATKPTNRCHWPRASPDACGEIGRALVDWSAHACVSGTALATDGPGRSYRSLACTTSVEMPLRRGNEEACIAGIVTGGTSCQEIHQGSSLHFRWKYTSLIALVALLVGLLHRAKCAPSNGCRKASWQTTSWWMGKVAALTSAC